MLAKSGRHLRSAAAVAFEMPLHWTRGLANPTSDSSPDQAAAVGTGLIEMRDYIIKPVRFHFEMRVAS
jgi:hypothetical protein